MSNLSPVIHIKICDSGWIIEKMAKTLADSIPGVSFSLDDRIGADLVYHLPYLTYNQPTGHRHIGFFTHMEHDTERKNRFFKAASVFEHRICQSAKTAEILKAGGFSQVRIISPGIDLQRFTPELRIGVVGRTYDSGRKGEELVRQVMDIPGIAWHFTGRGWPGQKDQYLTDAEMPDFYRGIDYILVPSLNEGGPMCVLEALACGRPVIASDVGWVSEFPHIPFETGNVDSLRSVLLNLQIQQKQLRSSVLSRTWENWVAGHESLFREILDKDKAP